MSMNNVPMIDISARQKGTEPERDSIASAVDETCITGGFLLVSGHAVPADLIDPMYAITYDFFGCSEQDKRLCDADGRKGGHGYFSLDTKSLACAGGDINAPGDQNKSLLAGAEPVDNDPYYLTPGAQGHFADNVWPSQTADIHSVWFVWSEYRQACQTVSDVVLSIFARSLGMSDNWLESRIYKPISALVSHHYPEQQGPPDTGAIRSGAHIAFGSLTLLITENRSGGLQVMGLDEAWYDIVPLPGAFIVNISDLMARWTNDTRRSTLYRVVNTHVDSGEAARRSSIPYFHTPNYDAELSVMETFLSSCRVANFAPVLAGEHHKEKLPVRMALK
ncbi:MAG: isopenicillin N synthase-like dioxygenase [Candidatus Azotimanducaceae bacterium]|jgi:isopenicillin N synthase-like dioxygenase